MDAYDVKVYMTDGITTRAVWRGEYENAWEAMSAAFKRYGAHPVTGISAMRVATVTPLRDELRWECPCGQANIPAHLAQCDRCGSRRESWPNSPTRP